HSIHYCMNAETTYDVAIVGGGLAGLSCAILLGRKGYKTILFEKETYPFHKVCGEYISMESYGFLQGLGIPLDEMNLPRINRLKLTAPNGKIFETRLPLGGFGISRYTLDSRLAQLAKDAGVVIMEKTKVEAVSYDDGFMIEAGPQHYSAAVCLAAFGKRSNLDVKWNRNFLQAYDKRLENFIAVKYHIRISWPGDVIGLHNFENGYCGISKIDNDLYCLCYMTRASELKKYGNQIRALEEKNLCRNPHLQKIFSQATVETGFPITISQVSFNQKTPVENHVLMLGDAAGMITPLCGNGMSIALHTGKIAAEQVNGFLSGKTNRLQMETAYTAEWKKHFASRLRTGRILQRFFGKPGLSNIFVQTFRHLPFLASPLVKMTHGKSF
ncbi:MAG: NAD(P)/FAD-dependent oxidoreductase, partial [Flavisolibacter sp.]